MHIEKTNLWTAAITPFTSSLEIDFDSLGHTLKRQEAAGNGILILGSTGEAFALSEDEKRKVVEYALALNLRVPLMVGTPNINLKQTKEWLAFCRGASIDAFLAATPAYTKPCANGQIDWFSEIMDASDKPVMLYNIPSRTGVSLHPRVLRELKNHRNFWALKESSGDLAMYKAYKDASPSITLYCGDDAQLPEAVKPEYGAVGLVSVASNIWPEASAEYVKQCRNGKYAGSLWKDAGEALSAATNPIPVKALMAKAGLIACGTVRSPLSEKDLSDAARDRLTAVNTLIKGWAHRQFGHGS